ncbi:unnamed protein product [Closterium sp. Yama58-4]|nr:unnamed protein product [Closterium sp. Yama58-4]
MARAAFVDPFAPVTRKAVSGPLAPLQQQQQQRLSVSGPLFQDSRLAGPSYSDAAQHEQQLQQLAGPTSSFATTPLAEIWWGIAPSSDAMAVAEAVWGAHHHATLAPHPASPSLASPSNAPIEATGAAGGCWEWAEAGAMAAAADEEEVSSTYRGDGSCPNTPGCNGEYPACAGAIAGGFDCGAISPTVSLPASGFRDASLRAAKCTCGGEGYNRAMCLCAMGVPHLAVPQGFDVEGWTTSCDSDMDGDVASVADDEEGSWGESECGPSAEAPSVGGDSWCTFLPDRVRETPQTMAGKRAGRGSRYMRRDFKKNRPNEWIRPRRDERSGQPGAEGGEAGGASGGPWKAFVLENEAFESYYKKQRLLPEAEWDAFVASMRQPLPTTFRINANGPFAMHIRDEMERHVAESFSQPLEVEGERVEAPRVLPWYPDRLGWHLNISRQQLRTLPQLNRLFDFVKRENEIGAITRQEAVSMIPPLLLDVQPHHNVLDMCAAPGSKTFQLLEMLHEGCGPAQLPSGMVVANELDIRRCHLLVHQTQRLSSPCILVTNHAAQLFPSLSISSDAAAAAGPAPAVAAEAGMGGEEKGDKAEAVGGEIKGKEQEGGDGTAGEAKVKLEGEAKGEGKGEAEGTVKGDGEGEGEGELFDRILCDVPCSGDGTMRKAPDIWKKWNTGNGNGLHALQIKIAMRAVALLRVGGRLVYSTCSLNPLENEAVVAQILRESNGCMRLVDCSNMLPNLKRSPGLKSWKVKDRFGWHAHYTPRIVYRGAVTTPSMFPSDEPTIASIEAFYGVLPAFPLRSQLIVRSDAPSHSKRIYLVSKPIAQAIRANQASGQRLKMVSTGVKLFERQSTKDGEVPCCFRLSAEGLPFILPFITRQLVHVPPRDFRLMLSKRSMLLTELSEGVAMALEEADMGCVVLVLDPKGALVVGMRGRGGERRGTSA